MDISAISIDVAHLALFVLGDFARLLAGALIVASFMDSLVSILQLMRR